jgi:hypothetical protein
MAAAKVISGRRFATKPKDKIAIACIRQTTPRGTVNVTAAGEALRACNAAALLH